MVRRPLPWFAIFRLVNQQQLLRNEYLAPENRILRAQLPKRMRLTDTARIPGGPGSDASSANCLSRWRERIGFEAQFPFIPKTGESAETPTSAPVCRD